MISTLKGFYQSSPQLWYHPLHIVVYVNFSPCYTCAVELSKFILGKPRLSIAVKAACPYRVLRPSCNFARECASKHTNMANSGNRHRDGLMLFNTSNRLLLSAFTLHDWPNLANYLNKSWKYSDVCVCDLTSYYVKVPGRFGNRSRYEEDEYSRYDFNLLTYSTPNINFL